MRWPQSDFDPRANLTQEEGDDTSRYCVAERSYNGRNRSIPIGEGQTKI